LYRKSRQLEKLNIELETRVAKRTAELEASTGRLLQSERLRSLALAAGQMGTGNWDAITGEIAWDEGEYRIFGVDPRTFDRGAESAHDRAIDLARDACEQRRMLCRGGRRSHRRACAGTHAAIPVPLARGASRKARQGGAGAIPQRRYRKGRRRRTRRAAAAGDRANARACTA